MDDLIAVLAKGLEVVGSILVDFLAKNRLDSLQRVIQLDRQKISHGKVL